MRIQELDVVDIKLDGQNPRHEPTTSLREAVAALFADGEGPKMVRLAEDIAENGLSPAEIPVILKDGGSFVVVEGNRRLAAVKLLANPSLAREVGCELRFKELAKKPKAHIEKVQCVIVGSREEARHWLELRHGGELDGAGVVRWDTEQAQRFHGRRGNQADKAIRFVDAIEEAYPDNEGIQRLLLDVRRSRLTTLGRLVSDPYVRRRLGITLDADRVRARYSSEDLQPAIERILSDLSGSKPRVSVTGLKTKDQRQTYIEDLVKKVLSGAARSADDHPLSPAGAKTAKKRKVSGQGTKPETLMPAPLFQGVALTKLGGRVSAIVAELQTLDLEAYPNAAAVLIRVVLELAVTEVHQQKGWKEGKLRDMVKKCVQAMDPGSVDSRLQPVRTGLADGTSLLAVRTIHAYLHNVHFNPTPTELRTIASNYAAFLAGLENLV